MYRRRVYLYNVSFTSFVFTGDYSSHIVLGHAYGHVSLFIARPVVRLHRLQTALVYAQYLCRRLKSETSRDTGALTRVLLVNLSWKLSSEECAPKYVIFFK